MKWGASLVFLSMSMTTITFAQLNYIESAAVSTLSADGEWIKVTGNDDYNTGIYASYSATSAIQGTLVVKMNGENVITGCLLSEIPRTNGSIILISRGDCPFRTKSQNVAQSGASGMILQNLPDSPNPLWMSAGMFLPALSYARSIVSIAVSHDVGKSLVQYNTTTMMIQNNGPYDAPATNMDSFKSQIIFYSSGVAVAAVVLILATRICRRRANLEFRGLGEIHDASGPTREKADELLELLPKYKFDDDVDKDSTSNDNDNDNNDDNDNDSNSNNNNSNNTSHIDDAVVIEVSVDTPPNTPLPKTGLDCDQCCICISDFQKGETILRLPCKHEFHAECVSMWLRDHVDCPLCKDDVYMAVFGAPPTTPSTTTTATTPVTTTTIATTPTAATTPTTPTMPTTPLSTTAMTSTTDDSNDDDAGVRNTVVGDGVVAEPVGFRFAMMSNEDEDNTTDTDTDTDTDRSNSNNSSNSNSSSSNTNHNTSINMTNIDFRTRILSFDDNDEHENDPHESVSFL